MAYEATTDDMLANAYNNWYWKHHGQGCAWVPDSTFEKYGDVYAQMEAEGRTITRPLSEVPRADLLVAMYWYQRNTDWRAFKRRDWEAAFETLTAEAA